VLEGTPERVRMANEEERQPVPEHRLAPPPTPTTNPEDEEEDLEEAGYGYGV